MPRDNQNSGKGKTVSNRSVVASQKRTEDTTRPGAPPGVYRNSVAGKGQKATKLTSKGSR